MSESVCTVCKLHDGKEATLNSTLMIPAAFVAMTFLLSRSAFLPAYTFPPAMHTHTRQTIYARIWLDLSDPLPQPHSSASMKKRVSLACLLSSSRYWPSRYCSRSSEWDVKPSRPSVNDFYRTIQSQPQSAMSR
ncbi:hypothetical protein NA56DRAFT_362421 [Hyaloscypha hepaticicola]|uniref:Uncharacterized protein n=1 Tax=Hyaloscypha hepaticicola TaxID=2082293 RepID=A0A2J6PLC6_9HELO|nr:hypothetical protein NA56DRAFT_362421 [Hyaloscypha hepaticicola]